METRAITMKLHSSRAGLGEHGRTVVLVPQVQAIVCARPCSMRMHALAGMHHHLNTC